MQFIECMYAFIYYINKTAYKTSNSTDRPTNTHPASRSVKYDKTNVANKKIKRSLSRYPFFVHLIFSRRDNTVCLSN